MNLVMKLSLAFLLLVPLASLTAQEGGGESGSKKPLPPPAIPAPDNISTPIHLLVNNLTKAQPPRVLDRKLILTWKGDTQPRYVAAAFLHEAYRQKHVFWRNQNGVYFLVVDLANDTPKTLEYRLVIDGLWQSDPANPDRIRDGQGVALSRVSLAADDLPAHDGPVQGYGGEVEFTYRGKAGQQVGIVGNFNQWDPFANALEETAPGEYHARLTLPPGMVLYRYVIGTKTFLDPGNGHTGHDDQGGIFSFFENKMTSPVKVLEASLPVATGLN